MPARLSLALAREEADGDRDERVDAGSQVEGEAREEDEAEDGGKGAACEGARVGRRGGRSSPGGRGGALRGAGPGEREERGIRRGDGRPGRGDVDLELRLDLGRSEALGVVAGLEVEGGEEGPRAGDGIGSSRPFDDDDGLAVEEGERLLGEGELLLPVGRVGGGRERQPLDRRDGRLGRDQVVLERACSELTCHPGAIVATMASRKGCPATSSLGIRRETDRNDGGGAGTLRPQRRSGEKRESAVAANRRRMRGVISWSFSASAAPRAFRRSSA